MRHKFLHSSINFAVICGGQSQRMQQDKALLEFDGEKLIQRICRNARPLIEHRYVDELIICSNNKHYDVIEKYNPNYLDDFIPDNQGPLAGLCAALNYSYQQGNKWLITMPCDTLLLPSDIVPLFSSAILTNSKYHFQYFVSADNREHPLFCIYNTEVCHAMQDYLVSGRRRVLDFFHSQKSLMITMQKGWSSYCNFNTLDAFEQACDNYQSHHKMLTL